MVGSDKRTFDDFSPGRLMLPPVGGSVLPACCVSIKMASKEKRKGLEEKLYANTHKKLNRKHVIYQSTVSHTNTFHNALVLSSFYLAKVEIEQTTHGHVQKSQNFTFDRMFAFFLLFFTSIKENRS